MEWRRSLEAVAWRVRDSKASQLAELAVSLPLLVVFVVGIFDFGAAYNLRQKLSTAAEEGAMAAATQPANDLDQPSPSNPNSVRVAANVVLNYLIYENVLTSATQGGCNLTATPVQSAMTWTYTLAGCPYILTISINRGYVMGTAQPWVQGTQVTVSYQYQWQFGRVIGLITPQGYNLPGTISGTGNAANLL
jgi:Flp pilus assembly protein TadG